MFFMALLPFCYNQMSLHSLLLDWPEQLSLFQKDFSFYHALEKPRADTRRTDIYLLTHSINIFTSILQGRTRRTQNPLPGDQAPSF
jgi:hypothetical protein